MSGILRKSIKLVLLSSLFFCSAGVALADQYSEQGLKLFQQKNYPQAAAYFEQSIKNAPWESGSYYYCALAYHYQKDFKKAVAKYAEVVDRFPGTEAGNNALAALKVLEPDYFNKKKAGASAGVTTGAIGTVGAGAGAAENKGTVEGQPQTRISFKKNQNDMVVAVRVNGRSTPAIFDPNAEGTSFSRSQLSALAINVPKGTSEFKGEIDLGGVVRKQFPITVEDGGAPAKIGQSFLDAFSYKVNDATLSIDLKRKAGGGSGSGSEVSFQRDGKEIIVPVEINGRSAQMIYDTGGDGVTMTARQAKTIGLKTDDAEEKKGDPNEGPQRGEPGWVSPEEAPSGPKHMNVRLKFGPLEKTNISCAVAETGTGKYPRFAADGLNNGQWNIEIDYKTNKIKFTRK